MRPKRRSSAAQQIVVAEESDDFSDDDKPAGRADKRASTAGIDASQLQSGGALSRCQAMLHRMRARPGSEHFSSPSEPSTEASPPPMGYSTIQERLDAGDYGGLADFAFDARQVFIDAIARHWDAASAVHQDARAGLEALEDDLLIAREEKSLAPKPSKRPVRSDEEVTKSGSTPSASRGKLHARP